MKTEIFAEFTPKDDPDGWSSAQVPSVTHGVELIAEKAKGGAGVVYAQVYTSVYTLPQTVAHFYLDNGIITKTETNELRHS